MGSGEDGELMGLDCEETGVSTDGRFFRREPGMMKGVGEEE
jgi:hypothetical protein